MMTKLILLTRYVRLKLFGGLYFCGWKVVVQNNVVLRGASKISLGNNVSLDSNVLLQTVEVPNNSNPQIVLGDHVGLSANTVVIATKKITIEKNVMIGPGCVLVDFDHLYSDISKPIVDQGFSKQKTVTIKTGTWIGANSTICAGVTVGAHSIVGANSVVTHDIPNYSVAVGIPAKVIKKYDPKTLSWKKVNK